MPIHTHYCAAAAWHSLTDRLRPRVTHGHLAGFIFAGFTVAGPQADDEVKTGCFIMDIKSGSPAHQSGLLEHGSPIITVNGAECLHEGQATVDTFIRDAIRKDGEVTLHIEAQTDVIEAIEISKLREDPATSLGQVDLLHRCARTTNWRNSVHPTSCRPHPS